MYIQDYEISATITSCVIVVSSSYILIITNDYRIIFIILSGSLSCLTRLYRIALQEYVMDHPLVYMDILFAIFSFLLPIFMIHIFYRYITKYYLRFF